MNRGLHLLWLFLLTPALGVAQPKLEPRYPPLSHDESIRLGQALVADLVAQKPEANSTNTGAVKIRDGNDNEREVAVRFAIYSTPSNWVSTYETQPAGGGRGERLTVVHSVGQPSQYSLAQTGGATAGTNAPAVTLSPSQLMKPFAASDFWFADLGLEFLHWPKQRVLFKDQRRNQPCDVLESINPAPGAPGYTRVLSWVDTDNGGIVHAEAYDAHGALLKQFDPTSIKKVRGKPELQEMEMRDHQTGSHTWIRFNLQ